MDRTGYIGGSDVPALLGVDPFKTMQELYWEKIDPARPEKDTPDIRRGRRFEPFALDWFCEDRPGGKLIRSREFGRAPVFRLHLDAIWFPKPLDEITTEGFRPVEAKCPNRFKYLSVMKAEQLPLSWELQTLTYIHGTEAPEGYAVVYCTDLDDGHVFTVKRDDELWALIQSRAVEFMDIVATRDERRLLELAAVPGLLLDRSEEAREASAQRQLTVVPPENIALQRAVRDYADMRDVAKLAEQEKAAAQAALYALLDTETPFAGELAVGEWKLSVAETPPRRSIDRKLLQSAAPLDRIKVWEYLTRLNAAVADSVPMAVLQEMSATCALDLRTVEKEGQPSRRMNLTALGEVTRGED